MRRKPLLVGVALSLLVGLAACDTPTQPASQAVVAPTPSFSTATTTSLDVSYFQGFETNTDGWNGATRASSGTNGITAADGSYYGIMAGDGSAYTFFDGASDTWPGDFIAEIQVYLDPNWSIGSGFDYSVSMLRSNGDFLRDFIFHVGRVSDGRLLVNGDNNSYVGQCSGYDLNTGANPCINDFILEGGTPYQVTTAGWYTLQHVFRDDAGVLAVDLNLLDASGNVVWTTTRSDPNDIIDGTGAVVGGHDYGWFVFSTAPNLAADDVRLGTIVPTPGTKDDCKDGGWQTFGFRNQGQCVASLEASDSAGQ